MQTRTLVHEEPFPVTAAKLFSLLHTPSAIRAWWGAAQVIVVAEPGGLWVAAWGEREDDPDYVAAATIETFAPPHRLVLGDYVYYAKTGPLPFEATLVTTFEVADGEKAGSVLRVAQRGFPGGSEADDFFVACQQGWRETFAGIRRHLSGSDG